MIKLLRGALIALLLGGIAAAMAPQHVAAQSKATAPLTPEQSRAVEQIIQDYLMNHPDFMMQVLQRMQQHMAQQTQAEVRAAIMSKHEELLADANSHAIGNPKGDVTIVEFFDYRCPYCKRVQGTLAELVKQDPRLRIVYKEFPILGPASTLASRAAIASRKQGKYGPYHDALMTWGGQLDETVIFDLAKRVGLNIDKLKADMKDPSVDAVIERNIALAAALHIDATPGFVVGDKTIVGADIDGLKEALAAARKPG
jgi:protein-disulfide isomerase